MNKKKKVKGFGADDTVTTNLGGKIRTFKIDNRIWKKVPTIFTVDKLSIKASSCNKSDGIIGQEGLLYFNIIYDWNREVAFFLKRLNG